MLISSELGYRQALIRGLVRRGTYQHALPGSPPAGLVDRVSPPLAIQPGKHCLICTGDGCLPDDFLSDLKLSLAEKAELRKATPRAEQLAINGNYDSDKESGEESDEDDRKTRLDRESERSQTVCRISGLVKYSSCVLPSRRLIRYL